MSARVLFVDDEQNVLKAVERVFIDDDIELLCASSAAEALAIVEAHPDIRVIVSDYRMPGMNGVELLREVYRRVPGTVRMVLSGFADTAAVVDAINLGHISRFIPKPWDEDELRRAVLDALSEPAAGWGDDERVPTAGDVLEHLPLPLAVLDDDDRIVSCTPLFRKRCLCSTDTCRGVPIDTLIPAMKGAGEGVRRVEMPDGIFHVFHAPLDSRGKRYRVILLAPVEGGEG